MGDSVYTFKVIVVGAFLGMAVGHNYFFQNYGSFTPTRTNQIYAQQATHSQPKRAFAGGTGFGFRANLLPRGVFPSRTRVPGPKQKPLGPVEPREVPETRSVPVLTTTPQDHQKLVNFLVNVIIKNHERKMRERTTTPTPLLQIGGAAGWNLPIHIHPFQNLGSENSTSSVIVHRHGQGQTPHVHIVKSNPTTVDDNATRNDRIQSLVPKFLHLDAPDRRDGLEGLPRFLTAGHKKEVVTSSENSILFKLTRNPIVPIRRQILPPLQITSPTPYFTKPFAYQTDDSQDLNFEGAGDGPINAVTQISESDIQIPSPVPHPSMIPTTTDLTRQTVSPTTTPTTPVTTLSPATITTMSSATNHITVSSTTSAGSPTTMSPSTTSTTVGSVPISTNLTTVSHEINPATFSVMSPITITTATAATITPKIPTTESAPIRRANTASTTNASNAVPHSITNNPVSFTTTPTTPTTDPPPPLT